MNRFAVAYVPEGTQGVETGIGKGWGFVPVHENSPPAVVYCGDATMQAHVYASLLKQWPGRLFTTFTITTASMVTPGPRANYTVSEKGMLPS